MITEQHILFQFKKGNEEIKTLRTKHEEYKIQVYGTGTAQYLSQISGLENEEQLSLRRRFSGTNQSLFSNLFAPINKIFKAKGGSFIFDLKGDAQRNAFEKALKNMRGYSLNEWLQLYWKDKLAVDPNGIFMYETDSDGNPFITYKSINSIYNYGFENQKLLWVIFEPVKINHKKTDELEVFRVIDEEFDYLYVKKENSIILLTKENYTSYIPEITPEIIQKIGVIPYTIPNMFGEVPAQIISDIPNTETGYKMSSIDNEIELAKEFLVDNSVRRIFKFLHGYPVFWKYFSRCEACKGHGTINIDQTDIVCSQCGGTGYALKKDVSDVIGLKTPEGDETKLAPDVAGYVSPPIDTWKQMTEDLGLLEKAINKSHWGVYDIEITPNTATGEVLRAQPKLDKLHSYSVSYERIITYFTDTLGKFMFGSSYQGSSINLGDRYVIGDANVILKEYSEAKEKKLTVSVMNFILSQYYNSEFENDPISFHKYTTLMRVDPLVHYTVDDVLKMELPLGLKQKKVAFSEWVMTKDEDFFSGSYDDYVKDFNQFVDNIKIEENGTKEVQ